MDTIVEERGKIIPVSEDLGIRTVLVIESKKGAVRANHWHKTDTHIMYILSGLARYVETEEAGGCAPPLYTLDRLVGPGDKIVTVPNVPHAMEFLEDSVMIVCSTNVRDEKTYLSEIVPCKVL
jgi:quercetin dioxygenase-like cupin family protein